MSKNGQINFPQFQLKIQRGVKQNCQICLSPFHIFKPQHICKRCFRSVCFDCSPNKIKTYRENRYIGMHRNCNLCYNQSIKIQQYIQNNRLHFSHDSDLIHVWAKNFKDRKILKVKRSKTIIKMHINLENLWKSFNYSFRQFISRLVEKQNVQDGDLMRIISNGIEQIEPYCNGNLAGGTYIFLYFICHSQLTTAVNLTLIVLEYFQMNEFTAEDLNLILNNIGFSQVQQFKLVQFGLDTSQFIRYSATINILPILITNDLINMILIKNKLSYLWKGVFIIFKKYIGNIIDKLHLPIKLKLQLLRCAATFNLKQQPLFSTNSQQQNETYTNNILKDYEIVLQKNKELSRQLQQLRQQLKQEKDNKFLLDENFNDSIYILDKTSVKHAFNEHHYNMLVQLKSQEIIKLKESNKTLTKQNVQIKSQVNALRDQIKSMKIALQNKQQKIQQIQKQKQEFKNGNTLLIKKMRELSILIMDKQQNTLSQNEKKIESIQKIYSEMKNKKEQQCQIY